MKVVEDQKQKITNEKRKMMLIQKQTSFIPLSKPKLSVTNLTGAKQDKSKRYEENFFRTEAAQNDQ